jgi:hypothetical protein
MFLKTLAIISIGLSSTMVSANEWSVLSRHGECAEISNLAKRKPVLSNFTSLHDFKEKLQSSAINFSLDYPVKDSKDILSLDIPSEGLSMILIKSKLCKSK